MQNEHKIKLLKRNIPIAYLLGFLENFWVWNAIWVLYYLRFTNYAGLGLLESVMIVTTVIGEIPTGAIADILGKKKSLIIGFLLIGFGHFIMGIAPSYLILILSLLVMNGGFILLSGTYEALIYDSLLSTNEVNRYEKILANVSSLKMISLAVASLVGGFMYAYFPGAPYIVFGLVSIIASGISFLLTEPPIDSEIFTFSNYLKQTKSGIKELFKTKRIGLDSIIVIGLSMIIGMNAHVFMDVEIVNLGWNEMQLGFLAAGIFLFTAAFVQVATRMLSHTNRVVLTILSAVLIAFLMIITPVLGTLLATGLLFIRSGLVEMFNNTTSTIINHNTKSKYRATTLSSFNMIANIPYVLTAYVIGLWMDHFSVSTVVAGFGMTLLLLSFLGSLGEGLVAKNLSKH